MSILSDKFLALKMHISNIGCYYNNKALRVFFPPCVSWVVFYYENEYFLLTQIPLMETQHFESVTRD